MKKLLLIFIFFTLFSESQAQSWVYHPFPTDSAVWTTTRGMYNLLSCCPPVVEYYPEPSDRYCLPGTDTLIGSNSYKKLYHCGAAYKGGLRDDLAAHKVYFVPADSVSELLIYDFSVQAGDTAFVYEEYHWPGFHAVQYFPITTDSVVVNGNYRKRISFNGNPGTWVEGIGCTKGLFRESWPNVSNWYNDLECVSDGDVALYPSTSMGPCSLFSDVAAIEKSTELRIYPNPTSGTFTIEMGRSTISKVEIKDILGKTILSSDISGTSTFDLSAHEAGIYVVRISDSKGNLLTKKIVKQ